MESETIRTVRIGAKEIKKKLGIEGEIISFSTPPKQSAKKVVDKHLMIKLRINNEKKK
jgi:hypothetical protein